MRKSGKLPAAGPDGLAAMQDVLAESLPLARRWAAEDCWRDPAGGGSCAWYHGSWQTLRLLGVVSTLTHQAEYYIAALRPLIASGDFKRVFLSGSADYGLLSVIFDAFEQQGVRPEVTVVDRCSTPLRLCEWYAGRYGYAIETHQSDLGDFRAERPYDLVCVHSLLSCIPSERHADIVKTWRSLLRPGGIVMMANTIYPGISQARSSFSEEQVTAYKQRVFDAAAACPRADALPPSAELERMAEAFAGNMESNIISAPEQLTDVLEDGGFELQDVRSGLRIKDPKHQRSGAPIKAKKEYAWIVARRT
jgi:hypothetical protein